MPLASGDDRPVGALFSNRHGTALADRVALVDPRARTIVPIVTMPGFADADVDTRSSDLPAYLRGGGRAGHTCTGCDRGCGAENQGNSLGILLQRPGKKTPLGSVGSVSSTRKLRPQRASSLTN